MTPFSWTPLLDLAQSLLDERTDEATVRTVINRSYYAAFNIARAIVEQSSHVPNLHAHDRVWQWFVGHGPGPMLRLGHNGFRLSTMRKQADYVADANLSLTDAQRAVLEARKIIDALAGMSQRP